MDERSWMRSGAIAGIVFVILEVAAIPAGGGKPRAGDPLAKSVKFYTDHRGAIMTSAMLATLAAVAFLWFVVHLAQVAATRGAPAARLRDAILVSGTALGTLAAISTLPQVALAAIVKHPGLHLDESLVRAMLALVSAPYGPLSMLTALFAAVLAIFALNGGLGMRWVGWIAAVAAVLALIGGCLAFFADTNGQQSSGGVLGLIGSLLMFLAVLIASVDLLRSEPAASVRV